MSEDQKPSKKITESIFDNAVITDSLGREIKLRNADILDRMDLGNIVGEFTKNQINNFYYYNSLHFSSIDGFLLTNPPKTMPELRANLKRIGDEGFVAFNIFMDEKNEKQEDEIEKIKK